MMKQLHAGGAGWNKNFLEKTCGISLVLEGLDGLLEIVGGAFLLLVSPR